MVVRARIAWLLPGLRFLGNPALAFEFSNGMDGWRLILVTPAFTMLSPRLLELFLNFILKHTQFIYQVAVLLSGQVAKLK